SASGRSAAWLAHQTGGLGVASSNLAGPTNTYEIGRAVYSHLLQPPAPERASVLPDAPGRYANSRSTSSAASRFLYVRAWAQIRRARFIPGPYCALPEPGALAPCAGGFRGLAASRRNRAFGGGAF